MYLPTKSLHLLSALVLSLATVACDSDSTGPELPSVAGDWSGITRFATLGRTTSMSLTQSGSTVTGTVKVSGSFPRGIALTGEINAAGLLVFAAPRDCEVWGGTLSVNGDALTGPIVIDRTGCQGENNTSATMDLTR